MHRVARHLATWSGVHRRVLLTSLGEAGVHLCCGVGGSGCDARGLPRCIGRMSYHRVIHRVILPSGRARATRRGFRGRCVLHVKIIYRLVSRGTRPCGGLYRHVLPHRARRLRYTSYRTSTRTSKKLFNAPLLRNRACNLRLGYAYFVCPMGPVNWFFFNMGLVPFRMCFWHHAFPRSIYHVVCLACLLWLVH